MANSSIYQLDSPNFHKRLELLCHKAKKRKIAHSRHIVNNWQGKETFEFLEYRPYVHGDDLRKVDWSIYQRLGEVVVREYEIEPPKHLLILMDISSSTIPYHKLDYMKTIAAALVYIGAAIVDKVSFSFFPHAKNLLVQSFSRNNSMLSFFSYLQNLHATDQAGTLSTYIRSGKIFSRNVNVIVLSDFYNDEYFTSLKFLRNPCTAIQFIAGEEILLPKTENACFQDSESMQKYDLSIDKQRWDIYKNNFNNHLSKVKHFCWQNKINYQLLKTQEDISATLSILQIAGIIR